MNLKKPGRIIILIHKAVVMKTVFFEEIINELKTAQPGAGEKEKGLVIEEIYCLLSTAINLVILRLKHIMKSPDGQAAIELEKLEALSEWSLTEKGFTFCTSLDIIKPALHELAGGRGNLEKISNIFKSDDELANFIAGKFNEILSAAKNGGIDLKNPGQARKLLFDLRNSLQAERRSLVMQESRFIGSV